MGNLKHRQKLLFGGNALNVQVGPEKPVVVYVRSPLTGNPNPIRFLQEQEIIDRLLPTFEVVLCEESGDYAEILDRHRPDLVLFELKAMPGQPVILRGVRDNRSVPKALLIRSDPMCYTRPLALQQVEALGIDGCFVIDPLYAYYMEELADRLFVMPHSVDTRTFRDYGLPKTDIVAFFGHFLPSRPWRVEAAAQLRQAFPCKFFPHDTSRTSGATTRMEFGETYARRINAAQFVPVEGGFHHALTRKFFEVPACRSVLVAPRIPALAEYGFEDMRNCVLGDVAELPDKLERLLREPGRYDAVALAGMQLVHERHSNEGRTQLLDWLRAFQARRPGEAIRQRSTFGGFEAVPAEAVAGGAGPARPGEPIDHFLIRIAETAIARRDLDRAEAYLVRCMNLLYARHFLEPRFYLALVRLLQGRALEAIYFLTHNHVTRMSARGSRVLDPREAAMLVLAYLCLGDRSKAEAVGRLHSALDHRELRWALELVGLEPQGNRAGPPTLSLFSKFPLLSREAWDRFACDAMAAHGLAAAPSADCVVTTQ